MQKKYPLILINSPFLCVWYHSLYFPFQHNAVYILECVANADFSPFFFVPFASTFYLMCTDCNACSEQNNMKSVSIMTTNHLKAETQATPTVSGMLNVLQTTGNGQCPTYLYNLSTTVTNIYRIIIFPVTHPQHNGNSISSHRHW
jgi:hypothetical protein